MKIWFHKFRYEVLATCLLALWVWAYCSNQPGTQPGLKQAPTAPLTAEYSPPHTPPTELLRGLAADSVRSGKWATVRKHHLAKEPACAWCGGTDHLQVHHIHPFALNPTLHGSAAPGGELDPDNLITLCEAPGWDCHLKYGHAGHFKDGQNLAVRQQCTQHQMELEAKGMWPLRK